MRTAGASAVRPARADWGWSRGGSAGSVNNWTTRVITLTTPAATKALRHPHSSPIQAPIGAAQTVATETPVRMSDIARAKRCSGTRRIASAAAIDQKPPSATPSITRATSKRGQAARNGRQDIGQHQQQGQRQHHLLAVEATRQQGNGGRGDGADQRGGGDGLACRAVADAQVGGHGGQQAGRQEFGRDQAEHAQRQRDDGGPARRVDGVGKEGKISAFGTGGGGHGGSLG